jgi:hypothetical protein
MNPGDVGDLGDHVARDKKRVDLLAVTLLASDRAQTQCHVGSAARLP